MESSEKSGGEQQKEENRKPEELRAGLGKIRRRELERKERGDSYDPHFDLIDPALLGDEDLEVYGKFLDQTLKRDEFDTWRKKVQGSGDINDPRFNFAAWLANKLMSKENMRWFTPEDYKQIFRREENN